MEDLTVLKLYASHLSVIFSQLFTWSVKENTVPFTWKTSVMCPVPKKLNPSCLNDYHPVALTSKICYNEVFWTYPPPTHETHETPFRPIPVCIQAQQKHQRHNSLLYKYNAYIYMYLSWKNRFICLDSLYWLFLCLLPYKHTSWQANFWNLTLTQDWFSGLSAFLSTILRLFITKLHSRLPALFPLALHKALSYLYSFYSLYRLLHRHWHNTNHKIL